MQGLKIIIEGRHHGRSIPSFESVMGPIREDIAGLCWALGGTIVLVAEANGMVLPENEALDAMFEIAPGVPVEPHEEIPVWERAWLMPGRLEGLARFMRGDWTYIAGFVYPPPCARSDVQLDQAGWIARNAEIYVTCTDAALWQVHSRIAGVLDKIRVAFPLSESWSLNPGVEQA